MRSIDHAELRRRIAVARRMENELLDAIVGGMLLIAPQELPARVDALGDVYQRVIITLSELIDRQLSEGSGVDVQGTEHATKPAT